MTDQSEWWCALCPTSHPTRAALDKHAAAMHPRPTGSTSAQLRQTQTALAASQADLTRVTEQRDKFIAAADKLHGEWLDLKAEIDDLRAQRDLARAELVTANAELDRWRSGAQPNTEGAPA